MMSAEKRMACGTREDQVAGGDAEAAAHEGEDETTVAQTVAEVRTISPATVKTYPHEVPSPEPLGAQSANRGTCTLIALVSRLYMHRIVCNLYSFRLKHRKVNYGQGLRSVPKRLPVNVA